MAAALNHGTICLVLMFTICAARTTSSGGEDDIDLGMRTGIMMKMMREMSNQTNATTADSLNLPANASSIRENITDTFSCENRTYGYYADVDNDCQVFHVCLPSQTPSGRNVTYKWSFICPNETIFNQEVMVCTRPIDSIDCADSPMYYDRNDEIGKVNATTPDSNSNNTTGAGNTSNNNSTTKRKDNRRKQNIVMADAIMVNDGDITMTMEGGEMEDMMADVNEMKRKDVKRKQNIVMAQSMTTVDSVKELMANAMMSGVNMVGEINKKDRPQNLMSVMEINDMKEINETADGTQKENNDRIPLAGVTNHQNVHQMQMAVNENRQTRDKDLVNFAVTEENMDKEIVLDEAVSDFGTYQQGETVEDPIDVMDERRAVEKNFKRNGKRIKRRGSFRFKADVRH